MRPQVPGERARRQRAVLDRHPRVAALEADRQRAGRLAAAPDDADDAVDDRAVDAPPLDADRDRGRIDDRCRVVARQLRRTGPKRSRGVAHFNDRLLGAVGVLPHLRRRRRRVGHQVDPRHPLDAGAAVPVRHDQADRRAVIARQRCAVHPQREDCRREIVAREDPARAGDRRPRLRRFIVEAGDQHAMRRRRRPHAIEQRGDGDAFPVGDAHQPVVGRIGVARALDQVTSGRPRQLLERWHVERLGLLHEAAERQRPAGGVRQRRRGGGAHEEAIGRRRRLVARDGGEIGEEAGVETGAEQPVQRRVWCVRTEGECAEQLPARRRLQPRNGGRDENTKKVASRQLSTLKSQISGTAKPLSLET